MRISDWSSDVCSSDLPCRFRVLKFLQHQRLERPNLLDARFLYMTIAANLGGQRRQFDRYGVVRWRQFGSNHLHLRLIMIYQRALHLALFCIAENRSEEHTSELQSLMRISYAVFCLKKKK